MGTQERLTRLLETPTAAAGGRGAAAAVVVAAGEDEGVQCDRASRCDEKWRTEPLPSSGASVAADGREDHASRGAVCCEGVAWRGEGARRVLFAVYPSSPSYSWSSRPLCAATAAAVAAVGAASHAHAVEDVDTKFEARNAAAVAVSSSEGRTDDDVLLEDLLPSLRYGGLLSPLLWFVCVCSFFLLHAFCKQLLLLLRQAGRQRHTTKLALLFQSRIFPPHGINRLMSATHALVALNWGTLVLLSRHAGSTCRGAITAASAASGGGDVATDASAVPTCMWGFGEPLTPQERALLLFSLSYFIYDTWYEGFYGGLADILHHAVSILGLLYVLGSDVGGRDLIAALVVAEISTPLLHARYYCIQLSKRLALVAAAPSPAAAGLTSYPATASAAPAAAGGSWAPRGEGARTQKQQQWRRQQRDEQPHSESGEKCSTSCNGAGTVSESEKDQRESSTKLSPAFTALANSSPSSSSSITSQAALGAAAAAPALAAGGAVSTPATEPPILAPAAAAAAGECTTPAAAASGEASTEEAAKAAACGATLAPAATSGAGCLHGCEGERRGAAAAVEECGRSSIHTARGSAVGRANGEAALIAAAGTPQNGTAHAAAAAGAAGQTEAGAAAAAGGGRASSFFADGVAVAATTHWGALTPGSGSECLSVLRASGGAVAAAAAYKAVSQQQQQQNYLPANEVKATDVPPFLSRSSHATATDAAGAVAPSSGSYRMQSRVRSEAPVCSGPDVQVPIPDAAATTGAAAILAAALGTAVAAAALGASATAATATTAAITAASCSFLVFSVILRLSRGGEDPSSIFSTFFHIPAGYVYPLSPRSPQLPAAAGGEAGGSSAASGARAALVAGEEDAAAARFLQHSRDKFQSWIDGVEKVFLLFFVIGRALLAPCVVYACVTCRSTPPLVRGCSLVILFVSVYWLFLLLKHARNRKHKKEAKGGTMLSRPTAAN